MKVVVIATAVAAYRFVFANAVAVFRIGWLPVVLLLAVDHVSEALSAVEPTEALASLATTWLPVAVLVLISVTITMAYLRIILEENDRKDVIAYFWFGAVEFRYFAAFVLFVGVVTALVVALANLRTALEPVGGDLHVLWDALPLLVAAVVCLVWLRLSLQAAVILRDGGLGFVRAWSLLRGNTLRFALVLAAALGPVWALYFYASSAVLGSDWPVLPAWTWQAHELPTAIEAYFDWWVVLTDRQAAYPVETFALDFVATILEYTLVAGAIGSAYQQVTRPQE